MLAQLFALLPLLALASASPITKRESSRLIESGRAGGFCLSVEGGRQAVADGKVGNGTPVVTLACGAASYWDISKGSGSVVLSGTDFALDIGLEPTNNGGLKVWQSYPGATQQTWYLTDDNRIAQTGGKQCLDQGDNGPQTYECATGNTNQVYNVRFGDAAPAPSPSSSPAPPSAGGFDVNPSSPPTIQLFDDTPGNGQRLRPINRPDVCALVTNGYAAIGTPVALGACQPDGSSFGDLQTWDLPTAGTTGPVRLHGHPELCLDAGSNPANGGPVTVYSCGDGWAQQQWSFANGVLMTANNQCLNIRKESQPTQSKPYGTYADLQTWECSTNGDPYEKFAVRSRYGVAGK